MPSQPSSEELAYLAAATEAIFKANPGQRILPFFLGGLLDMLLLGLVISQFITYARFFMRSDRIVVVGLVIAGMITTVAASLVILIWITHVYVWNFGNFLPLIETSFTTKYTAVDLAATFIVQMFYVDRCCKLYRHWWPSLLIGAPALLGLIWGACFLGHIRSIYMYLVPATFEDFYVNLYGNGFLAAIAVTDAIITILVVYGLYRNRTGWKHTDSRIAGIIVRCVEAQIPALTIAIVTQILWRFVPEYAIFLIMLHTKVYVGGLLLTLNFRLGPDKQTKVYVSTQHEEHREQGSYQMDGITRHEQSRGQVKIPELEEEHETHKSVYGSTTGLTEPKVGV